MTYKRQGDLTELTVRQLRNRRRKLAREFPGVEGAIAGSLQSQRRRCGKEGCRCTRGELHGPYTYLCVKVGKRTRLLYVPANLIEEVGRRVALGQRVEANLAELSAINVELMVRGELD
jgi:hypothetical protein